MPFFSLPGELRNAIYDQVVYPDSSTIVFISCSSAKDLIAATVLSSPIYRVCRQIRTEAIHRLLATKELKFYDALTVIIFLKYLGKDAHENLRAIAIQVTELPWKPWAGERVGQNADVVATATAVKELAAEMCKLTALCKLDLLYRIQRQSHILIYQKHLKVQLVDALKSKGVDVTARSIRLEKTGTQQLRWTAPTTMN